MARDKATRDNTTQNATAKATNCEPSESTAFLNATLRDSTDAINTTQHDSHRCKRCRNVDLALGFSEQRSNLWVGQQRIRHSHIAHRIQSHT